MRIYEAAVNALGIAGAPVKLGDIYRIIIENDFYHFGSKTPLSALRVTLDRHCSNKNISQMHKD